MKIFELAGAEDAALAALESALIESGGEVTPEVEALMLTADIAAEELAAKIDGYGYAVAKLEGEAAVFEGEAKRLAAHATARKNSAKRLKENLLFVLQTRGDKTVKGKSFTASVTPNGGKAPLVIDVESVESLPEWARRVEYVADTERLREELESGRDLTGVAHLSERGTHLRLK